MLFRMLNDLTLVHFHKKTNFYIVIVAMFFLILIVRLVYLEIFAYEKYKLLSENNRIRIVDIKADRGLIKDRNSKNIVVNAPNYNLYVIKEDSVDIDVLLQDLSSVIKLNVSAAQKRVNRTFIYEPALLYRGLSFQEVSFLFEHINDFPGIKIEVDTVRCYLDGEVYSHVVGYMGEVLVEDVLGGGYAAGDLKGQNGIEKVYEDKLRGQNGARQVEVNNFGLLSKILSEKPSISGETIQLSIDFDLQSFAHNLMKGKKGAIVVLDIRTNEVILLYSGPTYDLNSFIPYISNEEWEKLANNGDNPLMNRVIEGGYPPGSVFKVLVALAGLQEGKITPEKTFYCNGSMTYGSFKYKCWKKYGHGKIDLKRALVESCDVYFYDLGLLLGIDLISSYATKLGFGQITGIDLPNEKAGLFPSRKWKKKAYKLSWYPGETIITSIGQGYIITTPLQVAVLFSTIFNGGNLYQPKVVKSYTQNGEYISLQDKLIDTVEISDRNRDFLLSAMSDAVNSLYGTGFRARVKNILVGGKTGTSQVVSLDKVEKYEDGKIPEKLRDHSWFASVFPADNPRYVLVSMIEHGGLGGRSASSITGAIVNKMVDLGYVNRK